MISTTFLCEDPLTAVGIFGSYLVRFGFGLKWSECEGLVERGVVMRTYIGLSSLNHLDVYPDLDPAGRHGLIRDRTDTLSAHRFHSIPPYTCLDGVDGGAGTIASSISPPGR